MKQVLMALLVTMVLGGCKKEPEGGMTDEQRKVFLANAEREQVAQLELKVRALEQVKLPPHSTRDEILLDGVWTSEWWINEQNLAAVVDMPKGVVTRDVEKTFACLKVTRKPDHGRDFSEMGDCQRGHYAFVIRTFTRVRAAITEYGTKTTGGTFQPGTATGDVVAFDLTTGAHVGGYRWEARSSDSVNKQSLETDLDRKMADAVEMGAVHFVRHP